MNLQELKQKLSEAGFSPEIAEKLDEILAKAILAGALSEADKAQLMELIDIDIEAGNLEADAMENMAIMLDSYADETEKLGKANEAEEEKIANEADAEAAKIEAEIAQLQSAGISPVYGGQQSTSAPQPAAFPTVPVMEQQ